jgi:ADP-heptose:LPS heptosyltransferase
VSGPPRILVIKHGAMGDFVQALGPFAAIRKHHADARITLLTTRSFVEFARASPYFDEIWIDHRPKPWDVPGLLRLRKLLRSAKFQMVYDLQTSERSSSYFHLMGDPPWSGIVNGCSHPHANPDRDLMHTIERQAEQLRMAGIPETPSPDLSWVKRDLRKLHLPPRFLLIVPGGAPHRPDKRWPAAHYAAIANRAGTTGLVSVVLGSESDNDAVEPILDSCSTAMSLVGQSEILDIPVMARQAVAAVGNDTGPMHLIAAAGCPSVVLFSAESNPALCAPRGEVAILRRETLAELATDEVYLELPI